MAMMMMKMQSPLYLLLALYFLTMAHGAIAPTASSSSSQRLGAVIAGMAAEGCDELTTACLLGSRSMTGAERAAVSQQLVGVVDQEEASTLACGSAERALAVAQPTTRTADIVAATVAAGGNVVFCPSQVDLERGEGLLESLAAAMEVIVQQNLSPSASLLIVVDDPVTARQQMQGSVDRILPKLIPGDSLKRNTPITTLEDVFATVRYVTPAQALDVLTNKNHRGPATEAASRVAIASKSSSLVSSSSKGGARTAAPLNAADLAAARIMGPLTRQLATDAVQTVHQQCRNEDGLPVRVTDFGQLAAAALQAAVDQCKQAAPPGGNAIATQMTSALRAQLEFTLQTDFEEQVQLLAEDTYQAFRKALSKLIIGPNLAADMQAVVQSHMSSFGKSAKRLVTASWSTAGAAAALQTRMRETITSRLAAAQAAGKFKPLPRKGVTVGLHWLLPKPFGNDYRQEPWLVHASDNLVYVPPTDKVTEVSPESVAAGDWRNQIVPSPVGNDMVFMQ